MLAVLSQGRSTASGSCPTCCSTKHVGTANGQVMTEADIGGGPRLAVVVTTLVAGLFSLHEGEVATSGHGLLALKGRETVILVGVTAVPHCSGIAVALKRSLLIERLQVVCPRL